MVSNSLLLEYFASSSSPINLQELCNLFSENKTQYLFIKNRQSEYQYANSAFFSLLGLKQLTHLVGKSDFQLYDDKIKIQQYRGDDSFVFEEEKPLTLLNDLNPKNNSSIIITMEGKLYPLSIHSEKPDYVLGIVSSSANIRQLDWDTLFNLTTAELNELLTRKSYAITFGWGKTVLSKRELQVLFELIHGYHAGQIAQRLFLKQTTVESYLVNIKNKLYLNTKSELISFVISSKLFHQIL
ncbi:MAG: helix-turn-helix transcriptional regulator [Tatlockia sp.]|nr:helix-turn-helix transcriptional regulator [Tatlockia sp.]